MCPMLRNLRTTTSGAWQSNWTTHTQNTAGMSQVYPNLESYVYIYIESCNVMHIWSLFTSDGSVAISKCSAKASCTSSAPRLLPLEDLFPAKFASNFSKNYMVSLRWTFKSNVSLTFTAHAYGITTSHGILLASMTFSLSTTGALSYFPQMSLFPLPDSQTLRLHAPGLSFFGLVLLSFLPTFFFGLLLLCHLLLMTTNWRLSGKTQGGWRTTIMTISTKIGCSECPSCCSSPLPAKAIFNNQDFTVSPGRFGVMQLGSQNRFCQVPFRSIWPIRPIPKFTGFSRSLGLPWVDNLFE